MARSALAGPLVAGVACAATVGLVFDAGGFYPVAWGRAIVLFAAAALLVLLFVGGERPGPLAAGTVAALALLTLWTAASWLWAGSPPAAPEEAQRVGAYLAAAAAVVAAGRRAPLPWLAGGVATGIVAAACWNLAFRLAPDWAGRPRLELDFGSRADPVGYGNGLALLDVVGILLLLGVAATAKRVPARLLAAALLVPVAADLGLLQSSGALVALAAGLLAYLLTARAGNGWTAVAVLALPLLAAAAVARVHAVVSPSRTDMLAAAGPGHRLLAGLALLAAAQTVLAWSAPSWAARLPRLPRRHARLAAAAVVAAALVAAPFALGGHNRSHYWRAAGDEVAAHPVLGGGAGSYVDWWVERRDVPLSTREAHSLYLETLAELGLVGLLLVCAVLALPLLAAARLRGTEWGPPLLGALVAYAVHAGVDFDWELAGVTLPVLLLGAGATVAASGRGERLEPRRRAAGALGAAALVAAGILALAGSVPLAAGADAAAAGRSAEAVSDARRALRFAPWSAEAWRVIARARLARGDRPGARAAFRTAVRRDPADWQTWEELARVSAGALRRAALAEAARRNPLWASSG